MFVLSVYFYGLSFRKKIALLDQLKLIFYIYNQICYRFFFLRNNSIQILVVLVVAELHIDKPLSEKKKKKRRRKSTKQTQSIWITVSFAFLSPDFGFPFPSNLSLVSQRLDDHRDSLASSLAWFCTYKLELKVSWAWKVLDLLHYILNIFLCCWWSIVKEYFILSFFFHFWKFIDHEEW